VDCYTILYVEDLNVAGVVQNHSLAKSISEASWSAFLTLLEEKAESAARQVVRVPAHFTSQQCFQCGEIVPKSLSVRTHICWHCGYVEDRDINAVKNILRAGARPSADNVSQWAERSPRSPSL
jgi:putative transposase